MKIVGIIAEYDPFHNGHADHIALTREALGGTEPAGVVAVMSGAFVQRGEPAAFPKRDRVTAALAGGADLVLELPVPWVLTSAEGFAFGGVSLLHALGCVDTISFGSECGDAAALEQAAEKMADARYLQLVRYHMEQGRPAAEAQQKALADVGGSRLAALLDGANNTLGIEYIKALRRLDCDIRPFTVKRTGADHGDTAPVGSSAPASYLRRLAREGRFANAAAYMPRSAAVSCNEALVGRRAPADPERMARAILLKLRCASPERLAGIAGVSEGLENRLQAAANEAADLADLLARVKTRRYPLTRLQRVVWSAMLGIPAGWSRQTPPYLRVLGMNERGAAILSAARKTAALPLFVRATQANAFEGFAREVWETECRASEWYNLTLPTPLPHGTEYTDGCVKTE